MADTDNVAELRSHLEQARRIAVTLEQENAELEAQLEKYVGKEPTVRDEMAYLQRCLNSVLEVCDQAATQATRWENQLPVPEWVSTVREAATGERPDNPADKRRRVYADGEGKGWVDLTIDNHGRLWLQRLSDSDVLSTPDAIREHTSELHEFGRFW
ncbi:hypothetical protein ACIQIE_20275 [Streptomyces globisporus]|uniref:hypothetical protein n=1 Tax=Streptomyces globisporus TaxID=1908 RepID=UPI00345FFE05|nr:hypothetical protein OG838_03105 [Streptomyces globisporus]